MLNKKIYFRQSDNTVYLESFLLENNFFTKKRPTIVICPGGGYLQIAPREAEPISLKFNSYGFNCFVLHYSCFFTSNIKTYHTLPPKNENFNLQHPLNELAKTFSLINKNADRWNVDINRVMLCGFSAGGHLASLFAENLVAEKFIDLPNCNIKPAALILGYPLLDLINASDCNRQNLREYAPIQNHLVNQAIYGNKGYKAEYAKKISPVNHVASTMCPTFIWTTATDELVNPAGSIEMALELKAKKVPFELHVFSSGGHGLSLAEEVTATRSNQVNYQVKTWFNSLLLLLKELKLTIEN